MSRRVWLVAVFLVGLTFLPGCGNSTPTPPAPEPTPDGKPPPSPPPRIPKATR